MNSSTERNPEPSTPPRHHEDDTDDGHPNLRSWLADFPNETLPDLWCIPATHHSATAGLSPSSSGGKPRFPEVLGGIPYAWARTQSTSVVEQLETGVRILDIRVDGGFRIAHSLGGTGGSDLGSVSAEINGFLVADPTEFVVVLFRQDAGCGVALPFLSTASPRITIGHDVEATRRFLTILASSGLTFAEEFWLGEDDAEETMTVGRLAGKCVFFLVDFHRFRSLEEEAKEGKTAVGEGDGDGPGFTVERRRKSKDATSGSYHVVVPEGGPDGARRNIYLYEYCGSGVDTSMQIWQTNDRSAAKDLIRQHLAHECHIRDHVDHSNRAERTSTELPSPSNYCRPFKSLGGVSLDATFIPYPPSWTGPALNRWFLDEFCTGETEPSENDRTTPKQPRRLLPRLGVFTCDFITKDISRLLIRQNYDDRRRRRCRAKDRGDEPRSTTLIHDRTKESPMHDAQNGDDAVPISTPTPGRPGMFRRIRERTIAPFALRPVFRVGPNNRGGVRRVEIDPTGFPSLGDLFPRRRSDASFDRYSIGATATSAEVETDVLANVRQWYNGESFRHGVVGEYRNRRSCFAVRGYMTDHPQETFEALAVRVRMDLVEESCTYGGHNMIRYNDHISWRLFLDISRTDRPGHGWGNELWLEFV